MSDPFGPLYDSELAPAPPDDPAPPLAPVAIKAARAQLTAVSRRPSVWPLLGAASLCAGAGLALAAVVILGPPGLKSERAGPVDLALSPVLSR